jgi:hypothetical protein
MDWMGTIPAEDWDEEDYDEQDIAVYRFDPENDPMPMMMWIDIIERDPLPCPCCGWNWGDSDQDTKPLGLEELGPCECELEYEQRLEREYRRMMEQESIQNEL